MANAMKNPQKSQICISGGMIDTFIRSSNAKLANPNCSMCLKYSARMASSIKTEPASV